MPQLWLSYKALGAVLAVLSHPARLRIVDELATGERDVNALKVALNISQSAVSQHLAILRAHQLVLERREGRHVIYWLAHPKMPAWLRHGHELLHEPLEATWAPWAKATKTREIFETKKNGKRAVRRVSRQA